MGSSNVFPDVHMVSSWSICMGSEQPHGVPTRSSARGPEASPSMLRSPACRKAQRRGGRRHEVGSGSLVRFGECDYVFFGT